VLRVVNELRKQMVAVKPRNQHVWDPRPVPHETETEAETNYCETETEIETKKWSGDHVDLETLTSLYTTACIHVSYEFKFTLALSCYMYPKWDTVRAPVHFSIFCFTESTTAGAKFSTHIRPCGVGL